MTDEEIFLKLDRHIDYLTCKHLLTGIKINGCTFVIVNDENSAELGSCSILGQAELNQWILGKTSSV